MNGVNDLVTKIDDGYIAWEVQTADNKIISLTNIPWREKAVYMVSNFNSGKQASIDAVAAKFIRYPEMLSTNRIDEFGMPPEKLFFSDKTVMTIEIYSVTGEPDERNKTVTLAQFQKWLDDYNECCYIVKNGTEITEILGVYRP